MARLNKRPSSTKRINPVARELAKGQYQQKIVPNKLHKPAKHKKSLNDD